MKRKKKKPWHYLKTKPCYFLGEFSILLLIFALFCFILWGKNIIELVAGHLAKPSKTLLVLCLTWGTMNPGFFQGSPEQASLSHSLPLASLAELQAPPRMPLPQGLAPHPTPFLYTGLCSPASHGLSSFCALSVLLTAAG